MDLSRRNFLRAASVAGMSALGSCAAPLGSKRSYLTGVIQVGDFVEPDAFWTDVMFQGVRDQAIGPPLACRIFAFGHLAGFLAVNGIEGGYHCPYPEIGRAPKGASVRAAYTAAAAIASAEALQTPMVFDRQRYLNEIPESGEAIAAGVAWGEHVGKVVQKHRTIDGGHSEKVPYYFDKDYEPRKTVDSWSLTGPFYRTEVGPRFETFQRGLFPNLGNMEPFAIQSKTQFAAPDFPDVRGKEFADQFEEVYRLGGANSTERTADQTEIAFFWEDGPRGGSVPAPWLHIGLRLALDSKRYSLIERSQLLAQMSVAMCDGGISAWHTKYYTDILRPETAVRRAADQLGNPDPRVRCDPKWETLVPTPPFPAYVSGHSTFSGAAAEVLKLWFGTDSVPFEVKAIDLVNWPVQLKNSVRHYQTFTQAADDNGMSRIYGGVHWQADNVQGLKMGRSIGRHVFNHYLNKC